MFTRAVFFVLRDTAMYLAGDSSTTLRYSETALTLEFRLPELKSRPQPLPRWLQFAFSLIALLVSYFMPVSPMTWKVAALCFAGYWITVFIRAIPAQPFIGKPGPTQVRMHHRATSLAFHFEVPGTSTAALPLGAELPLAAIQAIRVVRIPNADSEEPSLGLIEVRTPTHDYRLFAAFDTEAAARAFARALQYIVDMQPNSPAAS